MSTFKRMKPYLKRRWKFYLGGFFILILVNAVQLIIPKVIQKTIDGISSGLFVQADVMKSALFILSLAALMFGFRFLWRILIIGNGWYFEKELREDYYRHLLTLSQSYYDKAKIGDLMAYATNDLNAIRMLFGIGFVALNDMVVMMIASFFFMLNINPQLTFYSIVPLPLLSLVIMFFGKKMHHRFKKVQAAFSAMSGQVQETISGIRVVKAFGQEDAELQKVSEQAYDYVQQNLGMAKIHGVFDPLNGFIVGLSMTAVMVFGGMKTVLGEISAGEFVAFFSYLGMLVWPMMAVGWFTNLYQRGTASLKRINQVFDVQPEIYDENPDYSITKIAGKIKIKDLHFTYPQTTEPVFRGISTAIETGKTLAIVGKTGAGKSTFLDLLTRIYTPPKNAIFIDEKEIHDFPLAVLRNGIRCVPQDIFLFSETIANNIRLANPAASMEEIIAVTKAAHVYDDIVEFTNGFETVVGERGVTLSGGQKQRIAIARALLSNAPILILDDSLSAVDTKTEKNILNHLIKTRKGKTTIIVAHRISSIEHADVIIVLENGKISETGTHQALLEKAGFYAKLYEKQQLEEKIEKE